ncbi:MAG: hypothetical protein HIU92_05105 [Proteobacteria bacterium]|nr:hypothetical protein [Pseudomonadota bacterium]
MKADEYEASLVEAVPPEGLDLALTGLWWAGKGEWDRAHGFVQRDEGNPRCDIVHALLHRQEGDLGNAAYWYRRAGEPVAKEPILEEWKAIAARLLAEP